MPEARQVSPYLLSKDVSGIILNILQHIGLVFQCPSSENVGKLQYIHQQSDKENLVSKYVLIFLIVLGTFYTPS